VEPKNWSAKAWLPMVQPRELEMLATLSPLAMDANN
jgi:hypothetical protein